MTTVSKVGHTPGPWELIRERVKSVSIYGVGKDGAFIGEVWNENDESSVQENANAVLIAAAPELLSALEQCQAYLDTAYELWMAKEQRCPSADIRLAVDAAIAKARGGEA